MPPGERHTVSAQRCSHRQRGPAVPYGHRQKILRLVIRIESANKVSICVFNGLMLVLRKFCRALLLALLNVAYLQQDVC